VIAGLEAQRRQETRRLRRKSCSRFRGCIRRCHKKQQHCRNGNRRCDSNKLVRCSKRSLKPKLKCPFIRQLQQGSATAQAAQQATNTDSNCCSSSATVATKTGSWFRPQVGSRVRISKLGNTAEVLSSPDEDGKPVRFGNEDDRRLEDMNRWMVKSRTAVKRNPRRLRPLLAAATSACNSNPKIQLICEEVGWQMQRWF